jgi:hypothetical protein
LWRSLDRRRLGFLAENGGGAGVQASLIADVRGYTAFTQEHGDEAAGGQLLDRVATIVRAS